MPKKNLVLILSTKINTAHFHHYPSSRWRSNAASKPEDDKSTDISRNTDKKGASKRSLQNELSHEPANRPKSAHRKHNSPANFYQRCRAMGLVSRPGLVKANIKGQDKSLLQMGHYGMGDKLACVSFLEDSKQSGTSHISKLQSVVKSFGPGTPAKAELMQQPAMLPRRKRRTSISANKEGGRNSIKKLMPSLFPRMQLIAQNARERVEQTREKNNIIDTEHRRIVTRRLLTLRRNAHHRVFIPVHTRHLPLFTRLLALVWHSKNRV